ncbi:MAG: Aminopeptidase 2 mitochondrial [Chaenotheca gracillima]|nr:MAG: Aminopeptidase 2 mitochondrial [Chaenotheca gracillima]
MSRVSRPSRAKLASNTSKISLSPSNVLLFLIAFRIVNALSIKTFFQPDEYFQSLEPAWAIAFGEDSGAWITWEWRHQLRSSIHPACFAAVYRVAAGLAHFLGASPAIRAQLLIAAPQIAQAICAALGDFYTWKLASRVYGQESKVASLALALTVCSPWQWFCSTRTLSNCLETTLTIAALYLWPWNWSEGKPSSSGEKNDVKASSSLRGCLVLAALACVLRPTNLLIWVCLSAFIVSQGSRSATFLLLREAIFCGSLIIALSIIVDRLYYQHWTFPPFRFLYFNIAQSLAVLYGKNDWHYYISQGVPLLLTSYLPFGSFGVRSALTRTRPALVPQPQVRRSTAVRFQLAVTIVAVIAALSVISHKEVRFIYPLLPALHLLAAEGAASLLWSNSPSASSASQQALRRTRKGVMVWVLAVNIVIAAYTSLVHQRGVLDVMSFLRHDHEVRDLDTSQSTKDMTVGFLMPCHSTPWRSHLIHPSLHGWALGCEPPVNLKSEDRIKYVDEADRFYADPSAFMRREISGASEGIVSKVKGLVGHGKEHTKSWPDYLIFFEASETVIAEYLSSEQPNVYHECWRGFNTHWHDDSRRQGDVIVWCRR